MATIKQGILGAFSGKVANVVGGSWKGIATMRKLPASVTNPKTAAQVNNRTEFKGIAQFGSSINASVIKPLWDRFAVKMSGYNAFVMTNKGVFTSVGTFNGSALITSKGKLGATAMSSAIYDPVSTTVTVAWDGTPVGAYQLATDKAYILVVDQFGAVMGMNAGVTTRSAQSITFSVEVPPNDAHVIFYYLSFARLDGSIVSDNTFAIQ
jgi:Family of unknown function (DUF6266)